MKKTGFRVSRWKDDARTEGEAVVAELVEALPTICDDLIQAGREPELVSRAQEAFVVFIVRILRSLPPRRRGGLNSNARVCAKFLRENRSKVPKGRSPGSTEVSDEQLATYAAEIDRLHRIAKERGYNDRRVDVIEKVEALENRGGLTKREARAAAHRSAPAILRRIQRMARRRKRQDDVG